MNILLSTDEQKAITKIITAADTPEKLIDMSTPCQRVRVFAPGDSDNAETVFISADSTNQNWPLFPTDYQGTYIFINDASKIYVKGAAGDKVQVWIDR